MALILFSIVRSFMASDRSMKALVMASSSRSKHSPVRVGGIEFIVERLYGGGIGDKPVRKRMPASSSGNLPAWRTGRFLM